MSTLFQKFFILFFFVEKFKILCYNKTVKRIIEEKYMGNTPYNLLIHTNRLKIMIGSVILEKTRQKLMITNFLILN